MNILFLTYFYPPQACPRSVQIAHLNEYLKRDSSVMVLSSKAEKNIDVSLFKITTSDNVLFSEKSALTRFIEKSRGYKIKKAVLPDLYYFWTGDLYRSAKKLIKEKKIDVIVTFGHPMSTHLVGIKLKKQFQQLRWVAHFSDPWIDNPYNEYNFFVKYLNTYFQNRVFRQADKLIFTSPDTLSLVVEKYSDSIKKKSEYLPHAYDSSYFEESFQKNNRFIIRYLGNFYGKRQPDTFFQALSYLKENHQLPQDIIVEFIGQGMVASEISRFKILENVVFIKNPVSYLESLKLMQESDLLLLIDAKAEKNVFFPSKLVDYIASQKPIFGITPKGTSETILKELGYPTAINEDPIAIAIKLLDFINIIKNKKVSPPENVVKKYAIESVGEKFKDILSSL